MKFITYYMLLGYIVGYIIISIVFYSNLQDYCFSFTLFRIYYLYEAMLL
jgi:hypothetical protein